MKFFILTKWKRSNILFVLLLFGGCFSFFKVVLAQVQQSTRYELLLRDNEPASFEITPSENDGLFLSRQLAIQPVDQLEVIRLDTGLQQLWRGFIPLNEKYTLAKRMSYKHSVFFLFRFSDPSIRNMVLFAIRKENGNYSRYDIKSYIQFSISELQVVDNAILIGGYFNKIPLVLHFNLSTGQSKVLPGLFSEEGELTQLKIYRNGTFDVLINAKGAGRQNTFWIRNYTNDGSMLQSIALNSEPGKSFLSGRSVMATRQQRLVAGIYGNKNSQYSRGLFTALIDPSGAQQLTYYNFGDLENFFKYVKAKRENRIKERIKRKKNKGRKVRLNYKFLFDDLTQHDDQYILSGEAFYPKYKTIDNYYGGFSRISFLPGSITRDGRIFEGYFYTHAIVVSFDSNGKLQWDNTLEMNDIRSFTLQKFVRFEPVNDKIVLLYLQGDVLHTKIIMEDSVLKSKTAVPLKTKYEGDIMITGGSATKLDYWYDNYLYVSGAQYIVNVKEPGIPVRRKVFFINKIACR